MFRFLCSTQYITKGLVSNGDFRTLSCFLHTPFLVRSISDDISTNQNSFTLSYLINSCGLPLEKAISVSKRVQLKSSARPDAVLTLFRTHNFPNTHIFKIIQKRPLVLLSNPDLMKPKLEIFNSIDLSGPDLADFIFKNPRVLRISLEKTLIPCIVFLKSVVQTESNIITLLKRSTWVLQDPERLLGPAVTLLRSHGVSNYHISKWLVSSPRSVKRIDQLSEVVQRAKEMKFDPSKDGFIRAIIVLAGLRKSSWEAKFSYFKRLGWTEKGIYMAFKQHPFCMLYSEKKIMGTIGFLVNEMGCDPLLISKHPCVLGYSLEKRTIPRLSVLKILISSSLVQKDCNIVTVLAMPEKKFLEKFVTKFVKQVPRLIDTYREQMNSLQDATTS